MVLETISLNIFYKVKVLNTSDFVGEYPIKKLGTLPLPSLTEFFLTLFIQRFIQGMLSTSLNSTWVMKAVILGGLAKLWRSVHPPRQNLPNRLSPTHKLPTYLGYLGTGECGFLFYSQ
jgi:hypothetical protein